MRDSQLPASVNELMGKQPTITLENLSEVLGDKLPELHFNRIGRMRLINALQERFGVNYRNIPGVKSVIEQFDKEVETANIIKMNRGK